MSVAELLLKIGITIVVAIIMYFQIVFLKWTWSNQIDPKQTLNRLLRRASPSVEVIATRDPDKIYQDGQIVANVSGEVEESDDRVIFRELSNTKQLRRDRALEYKRRKLKIASIGVESALSITRSAKGSEANESVLIDVVCDTIQ